MDWKSLRLVVLSDTHGYHLDVTVPKGDVLIHCGDATADIGQADLRRFLIWFEARPAPRKILIAGNHDGAFEKWPDLAQAMVKELAPSVTYLQDSGCEIEGIKFWGSPVSPRFCDWFFNRDRGPAIKRHWDMIPNDTDVLITHCPPFGILDLTNDGDKAGCRDLYEAINRVKPVLNCFGHIHRSYGTMPYIHDDGWKTVCMNASICGEDYKPTRQPWIYEVPIASEKV